MRRVAEQLSFWRLAQFQELYSAMHVFMQAVGAGLLRRGVVVVGLNH